jgi:hypothetical protein
VTPDTALPPAGQDTPTAQPEAPRVQGGTLQQYADWPQKEDTRPQPWDLDTIGVPKHQRELDAGAPNTVSPVVIRHSYPILTSGSAGAVVNELASRLHLLGYVTDISKGENPFAIVTDKIMSAVESFREDYGVKEDPTPYGGNTQSARDRAALTIGPFTWEALLRASERVLHTL